MGLMGNLGPGGGGRGAGAWGRGKARLTWPLGKGYRAQIRRWQHSVPNAQGRMSASKLSHKKLKCRIHFLELLLQTLPSRHILQHVSLWRMQCCVTFIFRYELSGMMMLMSLKVEASLPSFTHGG